MTNPSQGDNSKGQQVVKEAKKFLGKPYKMLGAESNMANSNALYNNDTSLPDKTNTPIPAIYNEGIDSGTLVQEVLTRCAIPMNSNIPAEIYNYANKTGGHIFKNKENALPGDLVFFMMTNSNSDPNRNQGIDQVGVCTSTANCITVLVNEGVVEKPYTQITESFIFIRYGNQTPLPQDDELMPVEDMIDPSGSPQDIDEGFEVIPMGPEWVKVIKLPKGLTYCEPIYPDYVQVSDYVPAWVLSQVEKKVNKQGNKKNGK